MNRRQLLTIALAIGATATIALPAAAQYGSGVGSPQLSPYLYLTRGGQQGYLNYRQALGQQELQRQVAAPPTGYDVGRDTNRTTNLQANPQTTGINTSLSPTGHASGGPTASFMNYSHYYTIKPQGAPRY